MIPTDLVWRAERPPVDADGPDRGRPHLIVLLERPNPAPWPLRQVTRLAQRLRAEVLIASMVRCNGGLDELDRFNLRIAQEGIRVTTAHMKEQGIPASGEVLLARSGEEAPVVSDLVECMDPDLVVVLARRGSWFRLLPGSAMAHHLMRDGHRAVVVIPDHDSRRTWHTGLLELVRVHAAQS